MELKKVIKNCLKLLHVLPIDNRLVYFRCFNGNHYGFDQKALLEYIHNIYGNKYNIIWECENEASVKEEGIPSYVQLVKTKSIKQILKIIRAKYIFVNINPQVFIPYRKNQIIVNTWHGFGPKSSGNANSPLDIEQMNMNTYFCSHADYFSKKILREMFGYSGEIINTGAPRNDVFFDEKRMLERASAVRQYYKIEKNVKVVLYAPTFRDDYLYADMGIDYQRMIDVLEKKYGTDWVIIERLHPLIKSKQTHEGVIDASDYPDMQDLLCLADILISDYSGSLWDFSQKMEPVFLFVPDFDEYTQKRPLNISVEKMPYIICRNNDVLFNEMMNYDPSVYRMRLEQFYDYVNSYESGNACEKITNYLKM